MTKHIEVVGQQRGAYAVIAVNLRACEARGLHILTSFICHRSSPTILHRLLGVSYSIT